MSHRQVWESCGMVEETGLQAEGAGHTEGRRDVQVQRALHDDRWDDGQENILEALLCAHGLRLDVLP